MKTNYVMIDFENVSPENLEELDLEWVRVYLFLGENQKKLPVAMVKSMQCMGDRLQFIEISGTGHNALDFHIAYYIGRIAAEDSDAFFHIVSKDKGFDPLIAHLKQNGVFAHRADSVAAMPFLTQLRAAKSPLKEKVNFIKERFCELKSTRPRTRKTLASHISAQFGKVISEEDSQAVINGLFAVGFVKEVGKRIIYEDERP